MQATYEIGQEVWVVPSDGRSKPSAAKIAKIARKWVYLEPKWQGRFHKEEGWIDGGGYSSPGRIWPSQEEYESWKARDDSWREMVRHLPYSVPPHLTDFDLELIRGLIKV